MEIRPFLRIQIVLNTLALAWSILAFSDSSKNVLIGAEIELVDRNLSNLVEYFDFSELQSRLAKNVKSDHYQDYLQNDLALERLPADLREKLTKGLQLKKIDLALPGESHTAGEKKVIAPKSISESIPSTNMQGIILPNANAPATPQGIILGSGNTPPVSNQRQMQKVGSGIVEVPAETSWQELYARWRALPYSERTAVVDWELLSRQEKAKILIELYNQTSSAFDLDPNIDPIKLKLKLNAPAILSEYGWSRDGKGVLEFRHRQPLLGMEEFKKSFTEFARLSGTSSQVLQPHLIRNADAVLHIHFSFPDLPLDQDLRKQAVLLEKILFLEGAANGDFDRLLHPTAQVRYRGNVNDKGLLRLVDYNHIEIRYFPGATLEKLEGIINTLSLPQPEAIAALEQRLAALHPEKYIDKIIDIRPDVASGFLSRAERNSYQFSPEKIERWIKEDIAHQAKPTDLMPPRLVHTTHHPFSENSSFRAYQLESLRKIVEESSSPEQMHAATARMLNILNSGTVNNVSWLGKNPKKDPIYNDIYSRLEKHVLNNSHPDLNPFFHFMQRTEDLEHELFRELYNTIVRHYLKIPASNAWQTISSDFTTRFAYLDDTTARMAIERAKKEGSLAHFILELSRQTHQPGVIRNNLIKFNAAYPELAQNPKALQQVYQTLEISASFRPAELAFVKVLLRKKSSPLSSPDCSSSGFAELSGE